MRSLRIQECRKPRPLRRTPVWGGVLAVLAALVLLPVVGEGLLPCQSQAAPQPAATNPMPEAKTQAPTLTPPGSQPGAESADAERSRQIALDAANLLEMATDLKTEVYKTRKDTLSIAVIRKASQIEQLAHTLRSK
jgi:type VI protein secretion system component VasF